MVDLRVYSAEDEEQVISLWQESGLTRPWNPPDRDISNKMKVQKELFWVLEKNGRIIGTIMGAFDGHRGVVNYLAVRPAFRKQGFAKYMMQEMEKALKSMGCPKINLMVRRDNRDVREFYSALDYEEQEVVVLGKWLKE